jgi:hypothetical protein
MPRQPNSFTPLPREHGAWGLLLQSFIAGAVLGGLWTWLLAAACGLAILGFLLKEPLITLARQRFVWRQEMPESRLALPWLFGESLLILLCLGALAAQGPLLELGGLAGAGFLLTVIAVWLTVKNRQRSMVLQIVSAAGLCSSALLAALASVGSIPAWAWTLWAILTAHATSAIPVVHVRLQMKIAARSKTPAETSQMAAWVWWLPLAALPALIHNVALALPLAFSFAATIAERRRLGSEEGLQEPLRRVGFRLLAVSITHTLLTIAVLWRS